MLRAATASALQPSSRVVDLDMQGDQGQYRVDGEKANGDKVEHGE
jgi:hypothetical protein